jgi:tripartite-type tricarboxylate transporter receptor subunit TctC
MQRRQIITAAVSSVGCAIPGWVGAQAEWPTKPVKLIIGQTPGGASDVVGRDLIPYLQRAIGQPLVMDHRPGVGGSIAAEALAKADPDGYTLALFDSGPLTVASHMRKVSYDPLKSFTPIASVSSGGLALLANAKAPFNTTEELIAFARKSPGKLTYASSGIGSIHQLVAELFKSQTRTFIVHVPYRGASAALVDIAAGVVDIGFVSPAAALPLIKDGRVKALGFSTIKRGTSLPAVPSIHEKAIPGFDVTGWFGLLGPAQLPKPITLKLQLAVGRLVREREQIARVASQGGAVGEGTSEELSDWIQRDFNRWGRVIKYANIKAD